MSELTTFLLIVLPLAAIIQPNAQRLFAAVIFVGITLLHEVFLSHTTGLMYYGSAAMFALAVIILTSGIRPVPKLVMRIHMICVTAIGLNFIGFILWFNYIDPALYNFSFVLLYLWALVTLIRKDKTDVGSFSLDSWRTCFHYNNLPGMGYHRQDQK
jgi:hypothetical protein